MSQDISEVQISCSKVVTDTITINGSTGEVALKLFVRVKITSLVTVRNLKVETLVLAGGSTFGHNYFVIAPVTSYRD